MNLQRREEIRVIAECPNDRHWAQEMRRAVAELLARCPRLRVLALDPRGQGRSEIAATGYDYARRAADIAQWLAAAGCEDNVVLVGWSLGGMVAMRLALDHPDRVELRQVAQRDGASADTAPHARAPDGRGEDRAPRLVGVAQRRRDVYAA